MASAKVKQNSLKISVFALLFALLFGPFAFVFATPNLEINYQGKLTNSSGVTVADGNYSITFRLYTASTGGSAVWTEVDTVPVTNGLFSVMLGDTTALTGVDFNQTLYLGVEVESDGEMTPRKVLGTVPSAFEAQNAQTLAGIATTSFLRSDEADTMSATSSATLLTVTQNGTGDIFNLFDGSTEVFSILDGGNVGIGTSTPAVSLALGGTDAVLLPVGTSAQRPTGATGYIRYNTTTTQFEGYSSGAWQGLGGVIDIDQDTYITAEESSDEDYLRLYTAGSERLTVTNAGRVGIGTTAPTYQLDVQGALGASITNTGSGNTLVINDEAGDSTPVVVDEAGFVGIGTDSPSTYLNVRSATSMAPNDTQGILRFETTTGTNDRAAKIGAVTGANGYAYFQAIEPGVGNDANLILNPVDGNVGIGDSTPTYKLDVAGTGRFTGLATFDSGISINSETVTDFSGTGITVTGNALTATLGTDVTASEMADDDHGFFSYTSGVATLDAGGLTSANLLAALTDETGTGALVFANTPTLVTPDIGAATGSSLNLGSGTITSGLINGQTISSTANFTGTVAVTTSLSTPAINTASGALTVTPAAGSNLNVALSTTGDFAVNTDDLYVDTSTGYVGVGTITPSSLLHIAGANGILTIEDSNSAQNTAQSRVVFNYNTGTNGYIGYNGTSDLTIENQHASGDIVLSTNGNVGIGDATPDYKLDVEGTFGASGAATFSSTIDAPSLGTGEDDSVVILDSDGKLRTDQIDSRVWGSTLLANIVEDTTPQLGGSLDVNGQTITSASNGDVAIAPNGTGDFVVNTNDLYVDTSAGYVGVGTSTPVSKLHVSGGALTLDNAQNIQWLDTGGTARTLIDFDANENLRIGRSSAMDEFHVFTGGETSTQRLTIDTSGNVGIGTTGPTIKLQVETSVNSSDGIWVRNSNTGSSAQSVLSVVSDAGVGAFRTYSAANSVFPSRSVLSTDSSLSNGLSLLTGTTAPIELWTNSTQRMTITGTGNVGIGTTAPGQKLEVKGVTRISGAVSSNWLDINATGGAGNDAVLSTRFNSMRFDVPSRTGEAYNWLIGGSSAMLMDENGNVGIGTTDPGAKLDVGSGNVGLDYGYAIEGRDSGGTLRTLLAATGDLSGGATRIQSIGGGINFRSLAGADLMSVLNTGNVGIGTTTPQRKLHSYDSSNNYFRLETTGTNGYAGTEYANDAKTWTTGVNSDDSFVFTTSAQFAGSKVLELESAAYAGSIIAKTGGNVLLATAGGNVGIGTTSPEAKLDVDSGNVKIGNGYNYLWGDGSVSIAGNSNTGQDYFRINTDSSERVRITSAGNVGIGTTGPDVLLSVTGSAGQNVALFGQDHAGDAQIGVGNAFDANEALNIKWDDSESAGILYVGGDLSASPLVIKDGGNVGIGTTSPSQKLQVQGDALVTGGDLMLVSSKNKIFVDQDTGTGFDFYLNSQNIGSLNRYSTGSAQMVLSQYSAGSTADNAPAYTFSGDTNTGLALFGSDQLSLTTGGDTKVLVDSTGNVGIGTTGPAFTSGSGLEIQRSGTATLRLDSGAFATELRGLTDGTQLMQLSSAYLAFGTANTERVRIDSSGNVGIGTTVPGGKLNVLGTTEQLRLSYDSTNYSSFTVGSDGSLTMTTLAAGGAGTSDISINPENYLNLGTAGVDAIAIGRADANIPIIFNSNSAEAMRITSGNVGIGTTAPGRKLEVSAGGTALAAKFTTSLSQSFIQFSNSVATADQIRVGSDGANLVLSTNYAERMRIDSTGNVGIGTTAPGFPLHVNGEGRIGNLVFNTSDPGTANTGKAIWADGAGSGVLGLTSNTGISLSGNGTSESVRIDTSGNVGIGTTGPSTNAKLHIDGTNPLIYTEPTADDGALSGIQMLSSSSAVIGGATANTLTGEIRLGSANASYFTTLYGGVSEAVRVTTTGNVGIGTTAPGAKLDVRASANESTEILASFRELAGASFGGVDIGLASGTGYLQVSSTGGADNVYLTSNGVSYLNGGNVGIGTTSPAQKLHVVGNTRLDGGGIYLYRSDLANFSTITNPEGAGTASTLAFSTGGGEAVRIDNTGNVGIGTTAPALQSGGTGLHINGTTYSELKFTNSTTGTTATDGTAFVTSGLSLSINNREAGSLTLGTSNTVRQTIDSVGDFNFNSGDVYFDNSTGNVGIGTTGPEAKLDVVANGATTADMLRVSGGATGRGVYIGAPVSSTVTGVIDFKNGGVGTRYLDFRGDGVSRMVLTSAGNVGIGTTGPWEKLSLPFGSKLSFGNTSYSFDVYQNAAGELPIYFDSTYDSSASSINFRMRTDGTPVNAMTILGSGNVGIGTTSPSVKLDVYGDANFGTGDASPTVTVGNFNDITDDAKLYLRTTGDAILQSANGGTFAFRDASANEYLTLDTSTGNVGIGTTAPGQKLEVKGVTRISGAVSSNWLDINATGGAGNDAVLSTRFNSMRFDVPSRTGEAYNWLIGGSSAMLMDENGNVGIGTTDPGAKLHVVNATGEGTPSFVDGDDFIFQNNASNGASAYFNIVGGTNGISGINFSDANDSNIGRIGYGHGTSGDAMWFMTNNSEAMRIDSSGNVGIGTTGPDAALHVTGGTAMTSGWNRTLTLQDTYPTLVFNSNSTQWAGIGYDFSSTLNFWVNGSSNDISGSGTNAMSIQDDGDVTFNAGNVGIGTTVPGGKLNVLGTTEQLRLSYDSTNYSSFTVGSDGSLTMTTLAAGGAGTSDISINPENYLNLGTAGVDAIAIGRADANIPIIFNSNSAEAMRITSGNVGIGTTSPSEKLQIGAPGITSRQGLYIPARYNFAGAYLKSENSDGTGAALELISHADGNQSKGWKIANSQNTYGSGNLTFSISNQTSAYSSLSYSEAMRITSTGNVGIGTASPGVKLDVAGGVRLTGELDLASGQRIDWASGDAQIIEGEVSNYSLSLKNYDGVSAVSTTMFLESGGNVGIGTTSPSVALDVIGQINASDRIRGNTVTGVNYSSAIVGTASGAGYGVYGGSVGGRAVHGGETTGIGISGQASSGTALYGYTTTTGTPLVANANSTGYLAKFQKAGVDKVVIDNSGNVGIGTVSPDTVLDVVKTLSGANNVTYPIRTFNANNYAGGGSGVEFAARNGVNEEIVFGQVHAGVSSGTDGAESGFLGFNTINAGTLGERVRITNSGNVGIGTTAPGQKLEVKGVTRISGAVSSNWLDINATGGAGNDAVLSTRFNSMRFDVPSRTGEAYNWLIGGSSAMLMDENGNVGIGTTGPEAKLDVVANGATTADMLRVSGGATGRGVYIGAPVSSTVTGVIDFKNGGVGTRYLDFRGDGVSRMVLTSAGNVGIGTTGPAFTSGSGLEIQRSGTATLRLDSGAFATELRGLTDGTQLMQLSSAYLAFGTANTERVRIDSSGNVGIGTTGPSGLLQLRQVDDAGVDKNSLLITNSDQTQTESIFKIESYDNETNFNVLELIDENSNTDFVVQSQGNVGIGTSTPSAQLTTTGTVRFANFGSGTLTTDANGNVSVSSDERLKNVEGDFDRGLEAVLAMNPIQYHWNEASGLDRENLYTGFSAQDVLAAIPEAVGEDSRGFLTLSDRPILAAVINAIQEIWETVTANKEKIEELEARIKTLEEGTGAESKIKYGPGYTDTSTEETTSDSENGSDTSDSEAEDSDTTTADSESNDTTTASTDTTTDVSADSENTSTTGTDEDTVGEGEVGNDEVIADEGTSDAGTTTEKETSDTTTTDSTEETTTTGTGTNTTDSDSSDTTADTTTTDTDADSGNTETTPSTTESSSDTSDTNPSDTTSTDTTA